ncbi:MAG: hypothetical protein ACSW8A_07750 [Lachnospiraceae bacterium]
MENYKKGYCFSGQDGERYLITGDAVLAGSGETCYLVQELTGSLRLLVFTEEEIRQAEGRSGVQKSQKPDENQAKKASGLFSRPSSAAYQDSYRDSVREKEEAEAGLDDELQSMMIAFLETDSNSEKLNYLMRMKNRVTESMLDSMTISLDMEPVKGSRMEKYQSLESYLKLRRKYEGSRRFR